MLWKIYVFFKFVIFHLTIFLCSYVLGSNLQSFKDAKKLFIFQEMKLFNLKPRNSCFLGENFRLFHHCFFRRFHSFFSCFHFFTFSFLQMFSLLIAFVCFTVSLLFLKYSIFVLLYCECHGFEGSLFTFRRFLPYTPSCFYQDFPGAGSFTLKVTGLATEAQNTDSVH